MKSSCKVFICFFVFLLALSLGAQSLEQQKAMLEFLQHTRRMEKVIKDIGDVLAQKQSPVVIPALIEEIDDITSRKILDKCPNDFQMLANDYSDLFASAIKKVLDAIKMVGETQNISDPNVKTDVILKLLQVLETAKTDDLVLSQKKQQLIDCAAKYGVSPNGITFVQQSNSNQQSQIATSSMRSTEAEKTNQQEMMKIVNAPVPDDEDGCIDICLEIAGHLELTQQWLDSQAIDPANGFGEHIDGFKKAFASAKLAMSNKLYKHAVKKYYLAVKEINWIYVNATLRTAIIQGIKERMVLYENSRKNPLNVLVTTEEWKSLDDKLMQCNELMTDGELGDVQKCIGEADVLLSVISEKIAEEKHLAEEKRIVEAKGSTAIGAYMVVTLPTGAMRYTDTAPDLNDDTCRTTELWLRRILAGTFMMGSPTGELRRRDDETQHQVTLTQDYYIGVFEMTQKQYEMIYGSNPSGFKGDCRPVECVSYEMIRGTGGTAGAGWPAYGHAVDEGSFLGKLRAKTGLAFDLPTEAQWEYACRAGATTVLNTGKNLTDEKTDPAMDEAGRYTHNRGDWKGGYSEHTKVGSYLPNAWGLYDMHGNVYEWCLDWYGSYPSGVVTDPVGAQSGSRRVRRGGGWGFSAQDCRSADRYYSGPSLDSDNSGFRVVCPAP